MFFTLGHNAHKIPNHHHRPNTGDVRNRRFINRFQRVANKVAVVSPGVGRAHHTAMQHAGHAHVMHKSELAGNFGGYIHARRAAANHAVVACGLGGGVQSQGQLDMLLAYKLPYHRAVVKHCIDPQ